jgi:hypothetical protein
MNKTFVSVFFLLALLAGLMSVGSTSAFADTLQFNSTGPYNYLGEPSFEYHLTLDGHSIVGMCINNNLWISGGESWQVTVEPIVTAQEEQAAWLFLNAGNGSNPDYQGAVWYLFNPSTTLTPGAAALVSLAGIQVFTPGEFADVRLLVPTEDQTGWTNGQPQSFLVTPEPGTMALLGTGLLLGTAALRRRFAL